jgi:hypothetical protein
LLSAGRRQWSPQAKTNNEALICEQGVACAAAATSRRVPRRWLESEGRGIRENETTAGNHRQDRCRADLDESDRGEIVAAAAGRPHTLADSSRRRRLNNGESESGQPDREWPPSGGRGVTSAQAIWPANLPSVSSALMARLCWLGVTRQLAFFFAAAAAIATAMAGSLHGRRRVGRRPRFNYRPTAGRAASLRAGVRPAGGLATAGEKVGA